MYVHRTQTYNLTVNGVLKFYGMTQHVAWPLSHVLGGVKMLTGVVLCVLAYFAEHIHKKYACSSD